jgi:plastocyanin
LDVHVLTKETVMKRITLGLLAMTFVVLVIAPAQAATPKVVGTVGPGFTIKLTSAGKKATKLKAGKYAFVVADKASIHNFVVEQVSGGKFEKQLTTVPFTGTKTVTVTLKKGKWKYYCAPHESSMFGFFTVT